MSAARGARRREAAARRRAHVVAPTPNVANGKRDTVRAFGCFVDGKPCEVHLFFPAIATDDCRAAQSEGLLPCADHCRGLERNTKGLTGNRLGRLERHLFACATASEYAPVDPLVPTRAGQESLRRATQAMVNAGILHTKRIGWRTGVRLTTFGDTMRSHPQVAEPLATDARIRWSPVQAHVLSVLRLRGRRLAEVFARNVRVELVSRSLVASLNVQKRVGSVSADRLNLLLRLRAATTRKRMAASSSQKAHHRRSQHATNA